MEKCFSTSFGHCGENGFVNSRYQLIKQTKSPFIDRDNERPFPYLNTCLVNYNTAITVSVIIIY